MTRDPLALGRGLVFGAVWLVWLAGGYAFTEMHRPIRTWLREAPQLEQLGAVVWVLISTVLLACAIMYSIRAFAGSRQQPRA